MRLTAPGRGPGLAAQPARSPERALVDGVELDRGAHREAGQQPGPPVRQSGGEGDPAGQRRRHAHRHPAAAQRAAVRLDRDATRVLGDGPHRVGEPDPVPDPVREAPGQLVRPLEQPEGLGRGQAAGRPDRPEIEEQAEHGRLARLDRRVPRDVHPREVPSGRGAQVPAYPVLRREAVPPPGPPGPPRGFGGDAPGHQRHERAAGEQFGQDHGRNRRKRGAALLQAAAEAPERAARHGGRHDVQAQLPDVPEHLGLPRPDPLRAQVEHQRPPAGPVAPPSVPGADSTRPPTRSRASNTVTVAPEAMRLAAVRSPASPAPTTAKSAWLSRSPLIGLIHSLRHRAVPEPMPDGDQPRRR